jgi:hypothetical protein
MCDEEAEGRIAARFPTRDAGSFSMGDLGKKRRGVEAIAHLFLSCQDKNNETTEGNPPTAPGRPAGKSEGLESRGSVELVIDPHVYPVARVVWAEATSQDEVFQATIPLRKEVWLDIVRYCKQCAEQLEVHGQGEAANTWNRAADLIIIEMGAEDKRQRNREVYSSFAGFVAMINARTDMDKARKAQMIHEKACQLKVD